MPVSALKMRKSKMAKNGPFLKLCSSFLKYGSNALHSPKIGVFSKSDSWKTGSPDENPK